MILKFVNTTLSCSYEIQKRIIVFNSSSLVKLRRGMQDKIRSLLIAPRVSACSNPFRPVLLSSEVGEKEGICRFGIWPDENSIKVFCQYKFPNPSVF